MMLRGLRILLGTQRSHIAVNLTAQKSTLAQVENGAVSSSVIEKLVEICGSKDVSTSTPVREQHGRDESYHHCEPPDVVVFPTSTEKVSQVARLCYDHQIPIIPFGSGTGMEGGVTASKGGVCVDVTKMDQIEAVNAEDFDCTVQSGVTRVGLNNSLRDTGLWFPVDPGADCTLCGMCATGASGTNAVRYGTMRENVMNLEVVLSDGRIIETAGKGTRTKKSSAGYNLTNLFVGSEGTLGIITKATLKLYGQPESILSAICHFPDVQSAVDTVVQTLQCGIPMARIELLCEKMMDAFNKYSNYDYKVTPSLFLEFHGAENHVDDQGKIVAELCEANGGTQFNWAKDMDERNKLWKARHMCFYAATSLRPGARWLATDVCVPISRLPEIVVETKKDIDNSSILGPIVGHVGDGNFHTVLVVMPDSPEEIAEASALHDRMAERAMKLGGTCTGEHGVGLGKRHHLVTQFGQGGMDVMMQLKQTLDPKNIMNPGKVLFTD
ncbi:unnamed protein product [Owenia fusiformis]|uniref:Probable D-lactate dehydrogenase, mitochondrial n=1 Tax=Owenia fusiformis TaxID=6347 RepID=A0A8J1XRA1_OWEFU|nr:unnamed protein product [Owenia fusiformis]